KVKITKMSCTRTCKNSLPGFNGVNGIPGLPGPQGTPGNPGVAAIPDPTFHASSSAAIQAPWSLYNDAIFPLFSFSDPTMYASDELFFYVNDPDRPNYNRAIRLIPGLYQISFSIQGRWQNRTTVSDDTFVLADISSGTVNPIVSIKA